MKDITQPSLSATLPTDWMFADLWNEALLNREERIMEPRSRIWASELGKSPVDIFLKLKGEPLSNPPDARSLRKFEAGNIWEWIVKLVLMRAGVLRGSQERVMYQYPSLLPVTGYLDHLAGGMPDYERAQKEVEQLGLPEVFTRAFEGIVKFLEREYPNGLGDKVLEIKSVSSFMFDGMENSGRSSRNHRKQLFHYLKSKNMARGDIVYVCRDDCRMMQIPIINPSPVEDEYRSDIEIISGYYNRDEMPPLEPLLVFDEDLGKFSRNFNVAYSGYLTKLYGFQHQGEYEDIYRPMSERFNRVVGRAKRWDKMTDNNKAVIVEIEKMGFVFDECVKKAAEEVATEVAPE